MNNKGSWANIPREVCTTEVSVENVLPDVGKNNKRVLVRSFVFFFFFRCNEHAVETAKNAVQ